MEHTTTNKNKTYLNNEEEKVNIYDIDETQKVGNEKQKNAEQNSL